MDEHEIGRTLHLRYFPCHAVLAHNDSVMPGAPNSVEVQNAAVPAAAAIERYFQVSLFLLVSTGFAALAGTGRLDVISILIVSAALAIRALLLSRNRMIVIPERWTTIATLGYVLFFVADLMFLSGSYVTASVHLVLFSIVVKLFSVQRERDHLYLIVLSFLAVLSAAVLTVDTLFLASFAVFSLIAVNTFLSMEMRRSLRSDDAPAKAAVEGIDNRAGSRKVSLNALSRSLTVAGFLLTAATLVFAVGLFFFLPRLSAGYLSSYSAKNEFVSGFSETVQLGQIGRIKQSSTIVMHVELESESGTAARAAGLDIKWRGVALSRFDGRQWYNPPGQHMEVAERHAGRFDLWKKQARVEARSGALPQRRYIPLRYRVVMEPIGTNVVFLPPIAASLQARVGELGIDSNGSVFNMDRRRMLESYEATSLAPQPAPAILRQRSGDYPAGIASEYTQLPDEIDPRIHDLAVRVTERASSDFDKAVAIEQHLAENYRYTLEMTTVPPPDPIAHFLFQRREGHCEYFASAMAVLLRTLGIPSRIVNGFRNGEYNDITGKYIIRGRDAHSWVEVYLPASGWTSFDPTPPDPQASGSTWNRLLLYLDAGREFWREWVINYDFLHQRTLTISAGRKSVRVADDIRSWGRRQYQWLVESARALQQRASDAPLRWGALALALMGGIALLLNMRRVLGKVRTSRIARDPARAPQVAASIWYARMTRALERRGLQKLPAQTPAEFVEAIPEPSLRSSVAVFTEEYEQARFGNSPEHAKRLPELYEDVVGATAPKR